LPVEDGGKIKIYERSLLGNRSWYNVTIHDTQRACRRYTERHAICLSIYYAIPLSAQH